jgi:hypothetical protein
MPSKIITVVWIAPLGARWGVRHDGAWIHEDLPQWKAKEAAEAYAEKLRKTVKIVNVKTEAKKKKGRWR